MDSAEEDLLASSLAAFRGALQPQKVELVTHAPSRLFVALDGSDQNAAVRGLAAAVAGRTGAEVVERADLADAEALLAAAQEAGADLILMDAPFGEDYEPTAGESLGSVADGVVLEAKVPVLIVRDPAATSPGCLREVVVMFGRLDPRTTIAVGWAFGLIAPGGKLRLLNVVDLPVLEEAHQLLGSTVPLDVAALRTAAEQDAAPLLAAAQHRAREQKVSLTYEVAVGHSVDVFVEALGDGGVLAVKGVPHAYDDPSFHRALTLAQRARGPVLLV